MSSGFLPILLQGTVVYAAPYVLAAMGGYASERSGVINIALEGKMLAGAAATAFVGMATHRADVGLAAGIVVAISLSLVHWLMTQIYRIDQIISGMAINLLAAGGTGFLSEKLSGSGSGEVPVLPLPLYYGLALVLPVLLWLYSRHTRGGLRLMAVGSDPDKARLMGVQPLFVRALALVATGLFTGLAGAVIVASAGRFVDGMTAGRGYIALAALILGGWRPLPTLVACVTFGFFEQLQLQLQGTPVLGFSFPTQLWGMLPYLATVVALAFAVGRSRAPAGLGRH